MSDEYLWTRAGSPDPDVERLERLLAPLAHDAPLDELRVRRKRRRPWLAIGLAVAAAAAAAIVLYLVSPRGRVNRCAGGHGFAFAGLGGEVVCAGAGVAAGVLPVGEQLETGDHEATLTVADIGIATLGKQTRVRLDRTDAARHQLTLERCRMHAKVVAPPRLFAVATKHADVIDLGCEYTIEVDDHGAGTICVDSGLVELATRSGSLVVAPERTCAALLAQGRPGLPYLANGRAAWRAAIDAYERDEPAAFETLLRIAETHDAITLVALATIDERARPVLERLRELSPPPDGITVDTALADPAKLAIWRDDIIEIFVGSRGAAGKNKTSGSTKAGPP